MEKLPVNPNCELSGTKYCQMLNMHVCANCTVHCYKPEMREKIREVMRYSGPRMLFIHPLVVIRHMLETRKEKRRIERQYT